MYTLKTVKEMDNAELLSAYRRCCEALICECNTRRGETKRTMTNVERLENEMKKRLGISVDYIVSVDDRLVAQNEA